MDEEAVFRIVSVAGWLLGGIASIVILLLSVIAYFVKKGHDSVEIRLNKHDDKFDKVHEEIKELAIGIAESVKRRK